MSFDVKTSALFDSTIDYYNNLNLSIHEMFVNEMIKTIY